MPAGLLSTGGVALFTGLCAVGFVGSTLLFLPRNPIPLYAAVPVLAFLLGYSYAKRFTTLSHVWLGAALMLAPLALGWRSARRSFGRPSCSVQAVLLWVAGFDMIYACQDFDFDVRMRLRSVPARFGVPTALRMAAACHFMMAVLLLLLPVVYSGFGRIYLAGVAAITVLLVYEHWLVRPDDLSRVNRAFFWVNAVVSLGLLAVGVVDLVI